MTDQLTSEGKSVVEAWLHAKRRLERARDEVERAVRDLRDAEKALAKWMLPSDVKPGEKIAVWYLDSLIQVEAGNAFQCDPIVTVRLRGKQLARP